MVRATDADATLQLLTGRSDHVKAMKLLDTIYALIEQKLSRKVIICQEYPVFSQMYMETFLTESKQFIFDVGIAEMIDFVLKESK